MSLGLLSWPVPADDRSVMAAHRIPGARHSGTPTGQSSNGHRMHRPFACRHDRRRRRHRHPGARRCCMLGEYSVPNKQMTTHRIKLSGDIAGHHVQCCPQSILGPFGRRGALLAIMFGGAALVSSVVRRAHQIAASHAHHRHTTFCDTGVISGCTAPSLQGPQGGPWLLQETIPRSSRQRRA